MTEKLEGDFDQMVERLRVEQQDRTYRTIERGANLRQLIVILAEALNVKPAPDRVDFARRGVDLKPGDQVRFVGRPTIYTVVDAQDDIRGGILLRSNTTSVARQTPRARLEKVASRNGVAAAARDQSRLARAGVAR